MIYSFITDTNFKGVIKEYFSSQIIGSTPTLFTDAEAAAFSFIKSKLNARYDLTKLFPAIKDWSNTTTYAIGDYSSKADVIYKSKVNANTNHSPDTSPAQWEKADPRDALLIRYCCFITLFFLEDSINPRRISQQVIDNYDIAEHWLNQVKNSVEHPDFPLITIPGGMEVKGGSNPPSQHYY